MKIYEVQLKNKALFSKSRVLVEAKRFVLLSFSDTITFKNEANEDVALFNKIDIEYIREKNSVE